MCLTLFSLSNKPPNITATNIPGYRYKWISDEFVVEGYKTCKSWRSIQSIILLLRFSLIHWNCYLVGIAIQFIKWWWQAVIQIKLIIFVWMPATVEILQWSENTESDTIATDMLQYTPGKSSEYVSLFYGWPELVLILLNIFNKKKEWTRMSNLYCHTISSFIILWP